MFKKTTSLLLLGFIVLFYGGCSVGDSVEQINDYNEMYQIVLDKYRESENNAFKEYDKNYVDGLEVFINPRNSKVYYALYDIDKNGVPELLIGTKLGSIINIWALKNDEPVRLFNGFGIRDRCWLLKSDIILNEGSGGASIHGYDFYKMSDNGHSVELENGFVREYVYNTDVPIITQTNKNGSKEITADEFESIMKSYTGNTAFPFDYEQLNTVELEWNPVLNF